jgi:hypothetical protein
MVFRPLRALVQTLVPVQLLVLAGLVGIAMMAMPGCGSSPEPQTEPSQPIPDQLYVDWDHADWRVDRYILVNVRDFTVTQNLGRREPAKDYRKAITYQAEWDSVGFITFLALNAAEQQDRRRIARNHIAEARRVVLGIMNRLWTEASRGYIPNLNAVDFAPIPAGSETAVTTAIRHLTAATGTDPTNPAGWRDLAYFHGIIGDRKRQQRALTSALVALDHLDPQQVAEGDLGRLRRDIFLDLAWLARDLGQPDLTLAYLAHVNPWLGTESPERNDRIFEAKLLRGIALADMGEWLAAVNQARDLPRIEVPTRTVRGSVREDLRWFLDPPHWQALGYDRNNWPRLESDFGRRWIKALAGAPSGDLDHTLWLLGPPPTHLEFPSRVASRYWQDQGLLYARAGEMNTAWKCFEWSAMYRPYMAFYPLAGSSKKPSRMGQSGTRAQRYYTAYGLFFLAGDRGAFDRDVEPDVAARLGETSGSR